MPELIGTEVTNVVAKSDGIIRRLELVDGYPRVVPGQYVAQGQVLVSGMTLSQYERPLYSHAQAEVLAEVEKKLCIYPAAACGACTAPSREQKLLQAVPSLG